MIIEEIDESLFISRFEDCKRVVTSENKNGNFTYQGLRALFQYLEDTTEEENPLKLDVISLCCDFSEYENVEEFLNNYRSYTTFESFKEQNELSKDYEEEDEYLKELEEEISNNTTLIKFGDDLNEGFIIANY
jgi:hypothetical protein